MGYWYHRMFNAVAEVSHKPRSLQPSFSVVTGRFECVIPIGMSTVHLHEHLKRRRVASFLYEFEFKNDPTECF